MSVKAGRESGQRFVGYLRSRSILVFSSSVLFSLLRDGGYNSHYQGVRDLIPVNVSFLV